MVIFNLRVLDRLYHADEVESCVTHSKASRTLLTKFISEILKKNSYDLTL